METVKSLSINDIYVIVTGIVMGTTARLITLKIDFRQSLIASCGDLFNLSYYTVS